MASHEYGSGRIEYLPVIVSLIVAVSVLSTATFISDLFSSPHTACVSLSTTFIGIHYLSILVSLPIYGALCRESNRQQAQLCAPPPKFPTKSRACEDLSFLISKRYMKDSAMLCALAQTNFLTRISGLGKVRGDDLYEGGVRR